MGDPKITKLVKNEMDDPREEKVGVVGKLVKRIVTGGPQARKIMMKVETDDGKVGELVKKIHLNDPIVGKSGKLVRFVHEKYKKPEQDVMLAEAGEEK